MTEDQQAHAFMKRIQNLLEWRKMGLNYGFAKEHVIQPIDILKEAKRFLDQTNKKLG